MLSYILKKEDPEWINGNKKIQLGFAYFCTWKMEFEALGLRIGHKD